MNREAQRELNKPEYDFLKTNEHLGSNLCMLALGGSRAYGMDNEQSDWDFRGFCLNSRKDILTGRFYEQYTDKQTDTVIYAFNKFLGLLANCNPNVIEMLGCRKQDYVYLSDIGEELLHNKDMFLSKKCINSFGGYANQQLRRLQNALARDSATIDQREEHILNTILNMKYHLAETYPDYNEDSFRIYLDRSQRADMNREIFMDYHLKHVPLRDYRGIMSEMNTVINEYSKLNKRNSKKDVSHLAKHMAHLLRLYMMCLDILENGEIITYRSSEHDLLMKVRNSEFLIPADDQKTEEILKECEKMRLEFAQTVFSDDLEQEFAEAALQKKIDKRMVGLVQVVPEFWEILCKYEDRFEKAKKTTKLPDEPDWNRIEKFQMEVNEQIVRK